MLYVNCVSGASTAHFVSGVNTVLLPRSVAMESNMNYTFADLMGRSGGTIFNGYDLKVYYGGSNAAGSVIMIVSANDMTTDEAETLLSEVTHAHGGKVVGESTRISGDAVYRLHLPLDALDAIVLQDVVNSPLRDHGPNDYLGVITNIVYDFFLGAVNFFANLAQFVVDLGLAVIGALKSLTQQASNAIGAAVTVISNTLNAFKTWAMQFIEDTVNLAFAGINAIWDAILDYARGMLRIVSNTNLGEMGIALSSYIVNSPVFITLLLASVILDAALLALSPVISPFAFLMILIAPMVLSAIIGDVLIEPDDESLQQEARDVGESLSQSADSTLVAQTASQFLTDEEAESTNPNYGDVLVIISLALWTYGHKHGYEKSSDSLLYTITALAMEQIYNEQDEGTSEWAYAMILMVAVAGTAPILAAEGVSLNPTSLYRWTVVMVAGISFAYVYINAFERVMDR